MEPEKSVVLETVQRIGGYLHRIAPIVDSAGKVVGHAVRPLMVEVRARDVMQMIVGASLLAVPVAFTQEAWDLAEALPMANLLSLSAVSLLFVGMFVYFNFYRFHLQGYGLEFVKRVAGIYLVSLVVVGILLTIIQKCPWGLDNALALRRVIVVAFPASMSAAVSDMLR